MLLTDLLCYNSANGDVAFFSSDGSSSLNYPAVQTYTWEPGLIIAAGKFTASQNGSVAQGVYADLVTYNPATSQIQFYSTDGNGVRTPIGPPIATTHNWTHIVPGIFTPDGFYTDLLFYDQSAGVGEFYATDGNGGLNLLVSYPFVHWTNIVSGFFRPNAQTMDLLFYDAPRGHAEFYAVWNGNITLMQSHDGWLTTWTQIVPGTYREGGETDDFLLYDPTLGEASFCSTDGQGGFGIIEDYPDWLHDFSSIASGYFLQDMTCSSLVIYSANENAELLMGIGGQANENPRNGIADFGGSNTWTDLIAGKFLSTQLETWQNFDEPSMTRIEGYSTTDSVAPGNTIGFCIEAEQLDRGHYSFDYLIQIDRSGVPDFTFQGDGTARPQGTPADCASTGCDSQTSISVDIPSTCRSGIYYATLTAGALSTQVPFIVRPANPGSTILLDVAVATMQAYNMWGGHSLYDGIPLDSTRVHVASLDRPYSVDSDPQTLDALPGFLYNRLGILANHFINWLEISNEIEVDYCTSVDLHLGRVDLAPYRLLISHWHDEYWSFEMRSNVEAFLEQGGNVAFLAGNSCSWQVRFDDTGRFLTCYKYNGNFDANGNVLTDDPYASSTDPDIVQRTTVYWADEQYVKLPEISLTGLTWLYGRTVARIFPNSPSRGYTVARPDSWIFEGTGIGAGQVFGQESGIIGGEVDSALGTYPDGMKFGNPGWDRSDPNSPAGFIELGFCDLYDTPGFATDSIVPIRILDSSSNQLTAQANLQALNIPTWVPTAGQWIFRRSQAYQIAGVEAQGNGIFLLTLSEPSSVQWTGENVIFVTTGWASMGLFQYAGDPLSLNGWVFNAGTISWTNGLDPSNLSVVSKVTLNLLRTLG